MPRSKRTRRSCTSEAALARFLAPISENVPAPRKTAHYCALYPVMSFMLQPKSADARNANHRTAWCR
jgi:hypothetical protein